MMAEHGDSVELSDEQNLQSHLQQICLDYQNLLKKSTEMAPKGTGSKKSDPTTENHIEDDDFEGNVSSNHFFSKSKQFFRVHFHDVYVFVSFFF